MPKANFGPAADKMKLVAIQAQEIQTILPKPFKIDNCLEKYPINYFESMNTVLLQELMRYNSLINHIESSIIEFKAALDGKKVMTIELERVSECLLNNSVPNLWLNKSYPSLKPLMSYFKDLVKRILMFQNWLDYGSPKVYWISGFFFTQSFFTGVLQNYARETKIPIDRLNFGFKVWNDQEIVEKNCKKEDCFIKGLYLEGGRWNENKGKLDEGLMKEVYLTMPIVILLLFIYIIYFN